MSHQTVSRVINGHPNLRPATRDRVLAVIEQLQYRPNTMARALGRNQSRTIGVLASQRSHYGPSAAIRGIEAAAAEAGYAVHTTDLVTSTPEMVSAALEQQLGQRVDGVVIIAPQTTALTAIDELEIDLPYVMLHSRSAEDSHELFVDQIAGARVATRHLIDLGHRVIGHLAGPPEWIEAQARRHGFAAELAAAGLSGAPPLTGDWTADSGYDAGVQLAAETALTAVFCGNDQMALGLLHALRDAGRDVPGDVSVVGFDDIPEARHFWPPLTTVRQDFEELGRKCVARLLGLDDGAGDPIAPPLVVRTSTAPPSRG